MGVGECAGEVVPFVQFGLAASEREVFEAQLLLDEGNVEQAARARLQRHASGGQGADQGEEPEPRRRSGRNRQRVPHPPGRHRSSSTTPIRAKFANYLFRAHEDGVAAASTESAHQLIEEAQLFVDAAHQCYTRIGSVMP